LELLLENDELKDKFFVNIKNALVFNQNLFIQFLEQKNYLNDSYTQYKNKVGLTIDDRFLKQRNEVALVWPFKDCILEGGQSRDEDKREEIFFNEILAQDEITQLLEPKTLTNAKRINAAGENPFDKFNRDEKGNITDNLIIKGNNLLALHSLKKEFAGKVKLIYIDPPYNTRKDSFGYNDKFNHSSWLTFMKNRLEVAKGLLKKDGVIFVHCDDNEQAYLKVLLDEIFGRDNFVGAVVWERAYSPINLKKHLSVSHDIMQIFAKNLSELDNFRTERSEEQNNDYKNPDNDPRGNWKAGNPSVGPAVKKNIYEITSPSGRKMLPPSGRSWLYSKERFQELLDDNRIWWGKDGKSIWAPKMFLSEVQDGIVPMSIWKYEEVGHSQSATQDLKKLFDNEAVFSNPKPEGLLKKVLEISTKENDIVLDYHLGSGTTAATAHKMKRQYIGVEQMDYIENVCVERMKKVIGKKVRLTKPEPMQTELQLVAESEIDYFALDFDKGGISQSVNWKGGGDFVYLELKKYNQTFMEQIEADADTESLLHIWNEMKTKSFLNYNVDIKKQDAHIEEFKALSLQEQKQHLCEILDKNQLYVNLSSLNDADFECSDAEKKVTKDFYQIKD